uniref:Protein krueppel n=1 Tax=Stomoxys calcitrans TaxID=35570 RepID=A0A1I8PA28_STOCA
MSGSNVCRLCRSTCTETICLFDPSGNANEVYNITVKFFHPVFLQNESKGSIAVVAVLCIQCWQQIFRFHNFQQTVVMLQAHLLNEQQEGAALQSDKLTTLSIEEDIQKHFNIGGDIECDASGSVQDSETQPSTSSLGGAFGTGQLIITNHGIKLLSKSECNVNRMPVSKNPEPREESICENQEAAENELPGDDVGDANMILDIDENSQCTLQSSETVNVGFTCTWKKSSSDDEAHALTSSTSRGSNPASVKTELPFDVEDDEDESRSDNTLDDYDLCTPITSENNTNDSRREVSKQTFQFDMVIAEWKPTLECHACGEIYKTFSELKIHFKIKHVNERFYILCCERKFSERFRLQEHALLHLKPDAFKCNICSLNLGTRFNLKNHIRNMHSVGDNSEHKRYVCDVCGKRYATPSSLREHHGIHTGVPMHTCEFCGHKFKFRSTWRYHIVKQHPNEVGNLMWKRVSIECKFCEAKFQSRRKHGDHLRNNHPDDPEESKTPT